MTLAFGPAGLRMALVVRSIHHCRPSLTPLTISVFHECTCILYVHWNVAILSIHLTLFLVEDFPWCSTLSHTARGHLCICVRRYISTTFVQRLTASLMHLPEAI